MSGGALGYVHSDIRHQVLEKIEHGEIHHGDGVNPDIVEWNVGETMEYLDDLAGLLRAYEWWQSGDTGEPKYREVEDAFMDKWD